MDRQDLKDHKYDILHLAYFLSRRKSVHAELESACLSELNEDRLCIALLDRLLCVV